MVLCAAVNPRVNFKLLVMVGQKFVMVEQETVMVWQMPAHAHPWLRHWLEIGEDGSAIRAGVTVIYVSPGNVFPAHISLGIRVSPHTYH